MYRLVPSSSPSHRLPLPPAPRVPLTRSAAPNRDLTAVEIVSYPCAATAPALSSPSPTPSAPASRFNPCGRRPLISPSSGATHEATPRPRRDRIRSTELAGPPYPPLRPAHTAQPPELRCPALHPGSPGPYTSLAYAPCQPPPISSDSKPARAITPWCLAGVGPPEPPSLSVETCARSSRRPVCPVDPCRFCMLELGRRSAERAVAARLMLLSRCLSRMSLSAAAILCSLKVPPASLVAMLRPAAFFTGHLTTGHS